MAQIMISLAQIEDRDMSRKSWGKLCVDKFHLDEGTLFPVSDILIANDFEEALWIFKCLPKHVDLWERYTQWSIAQLKGELDNLHSSRKPCDKAELIVKLTSTLITANFLQHEIVSTAKYPDVQATWCSLIVQNIAASDDKLASQLENKLRQILDTGEWSDE